MPSVDAFQMRFVIHVFAVTLVIVVTGAVAVAVLLSTILLISCAHEAPLSPGWRLLLLPAQRLSAGSCTLQSLLCGLALLHTHL